MDTKEIILDAALELFNRLDTAVVTTNHIAQASGISPGNLYYHYRNKGEIIRALFERVFNEWDTALAPDATHAPTLDDIENLTRANFRILWKYRFIHRELVALLRQDETLKKRFLEVRARGFQGFQAMFGRFVEVGLIQAADGPEAIQEIAELCWLISEFWLTYVEVSGRDVDAGELERGIRLMLRVIGV